MFARQPTVFGLALPPLLLLLLVLMTVIMMMMLKDNTSDRSVTAVWCLL